MGIKVKNKSKKDENKRWCKSGMPGVAVGLPFDGSPTGQLEALVFVEDFWGAESYPAPEMWVKNKRGDYHHSNPRPRVPLVEVG